MATQTKRDKRVEMIHIAVLIGGLLAIFELTIEPDTPLLYPLVIALVWVTWYYLFVKWLPRKYSGQV